MSTATTDPSIQFGIIDTKTGEFKEGYIDKAGKMAYRNPLPLWRRLLGQKSREEMWGESMFVRTVSVTASESGPFSRRQSWSLSTGIYKQVHKMTGARRYWARSSLGDFDIDSNAFESDGSVICL